MLEHRTVGTPFDTLAGEERQRAAAAISRGDRAMVRAWPRLFAYQFLYRLDAG